MTLRASARTCLLAAAAVSAANSAGAGVWYSDPVLGLAAEYSSNPGLLDTEHTAETHGAVLIDAPTTYHADAGSFTLQPSFRISDSSGYSSLASDYEHLTATGELDFERDIFSLKGQIARDSSLYYDYSVNGSTGVRRDTALADVTWLRTLTERSSFDLDLSSSRVIYGEANSFTTLTDYHYSSATPTLSWNLGERTTLNVIGSVGDYLSADGHTKSANADLQAGFTKKINELWTLTAAGGYSRENNRIDEYFGPFFLGTFKSTDTGSLFTVNLTRQGQRLAFTAAASRSLVPLGYALLSRQDSYQLSFDFARTQRWTFDGHVRRLDAEEPQILGVTVRQSYWDAGVSAAWLFTERWTLTLKATHVSARYSPPVVDVAATGFTAQLTRRFDRVSWR